MISHGPNFMLSFLPSLTTFSLLIFAIVDLFELQEPLQGEREIGIGELHGRRHAWTYPAEYDMQELCNHFRPAGERSGQKVPLQSYSRKPLRQIF